MQKINLNKIEKIGIWLWRLFMAVIVSGILFNQQNFAAESRIKYDYTKALIENTAEIVSSYKDQPEIPDAENKEYQASCPAEPSILDDPGKIVAFFEMVDSLNIPDDPFKHQLLMALLIGDREGAYDYLERKVTNGFPNY